MSHNDVVYISDSPTPPSEPYSQVPLDSDIEIVDVLGEGSADTRTIWRERQKKKDIKRKQERDKKAAADTSATATTTITPSSSTSSTSTPATDTEVVLLDSPPVFKTKKVARAPVVVEPVAPPPPPPAPVFDSAFKCPICLETDRKLKEDGIGFMALSCGHVTCKPCAALLKGPGQKQECPTCRKKITKKSMPIFL